MLKFPADAPKKRVLRALGALGFEIVREGTHIAMVRQHDDGTRIPLTLPNHRKIKASTLRTLLRQARIPREDFLAAYEDS